MRRFHPFLDCRPNMIRAVMADDSSMRRFSFVIDHMLFTLELNGAQTVIRCWRGRVAQEDENDIHESGRGIGLTEMDTVLTCLDLPEPFEPSSAEDVAAFLPGFLDLLAGPGATEIIHMARIALTAAIDWWEGADSSDKAVFRHSEMSPFNTLQEPDGVSIHIHNLVDMTGHVTGMDELARALRFPRTRVKDGDHIQRMRLEAPRIHALANWADKSGHEKAALIARGMALAEKYDIDLNKNIEALQACFREHSA